MLTRCPGCGALPTVGVLCDSCAGAIPPVDGLIREHVSSHLPRAEAAAWLIDGFGLAHAVAATRTLIGRRATADLVVLHGSVSRDHAELVHSGDGWLLRDLGSRNRTQVDGKRVDGRAMLGDRAVIRFGDVLLHFIGRPVPLGADPRPLATTHAAEDGAFRFTLRGPVVDLCVLGAAGSAGAGGAVLSRDAAASEWTEISLPPLEFQLLRVLCVRAIEDSGSPSRARGCVPTKQLAKSLPFQSRYANEENVRQVVRRIRATLAEIGAEGVIEAVPGRGYYVTWPVTAA